MIQQAEIKAATNSHELDMQHMRAASSLDKLQVMDVKAQTNFTLTTHEHVVFDMENKLYVWA